MRLPWVIGQVAKFPLMPTSHYMVDMIVNEQSDQHVRVEQDAH
jgi:hypothetical protein